MSGWVFVLIFVIAVIARGNLSEDDTWKLTMALLVLLTAIINWMMLNELQAITEYLLPE